MDGWGLLSRLYQVLFYVKGYFVYYGSNIDMVVKAMELNRLSRKLVLYNRLCKNGSFQ